jgi:TPR repeat protein
MNMIPKSTTSPAIYAMPREDADKRHQFYQGALRDLQAAAKRGCARSQFELGVMYAQGIGVEVDTRRCIFLE